MPTFLTPNRHGYSVRFSPFQPERIACATSQYFGLAGGGTLFILEVVPENGLVEVASTQWTDGLFDVVWSETDANIIVTASGDGGLQLWNISCPQLPPQTFREHRKEVYSVDWSQTRQEQFVLSASWDCSIKLWDPNRVNSLNTFLGHSQLVYSAMWSPHVPACFASVSGDGTLKIWNSLMPQQPTVSVRAHDAEVLSCDWCKYDQNILATGGSEGLIRGWDIRSMTSPVFEQKGCEYAVRRVRFSPHNLSILAAVSYDFTTRIWDFKTSTDPLETIKHHSEFVYGLDFNNQVAGQIADCGWDSLVHVYSPRSLLPLSSPLIPPINIGALRTSRIDCLLVDAGEPSFSRQQNILLGRYGVEIFGLPKHPTYKPLLRPQFNRYYKNQPSLPRPANIRLDAFLQCLGIRFPTPVQYPCSTVSPWRLLHPIFDFRLTVLSKDHTSPTVFNAFIYTDGSASINSVAYAFFCHNRPQSFKLHSFCTVYTAEKYTILKALRYVELAPENKFVLCSDFLSSLQSLNVIYTTDALSMQVQLLIDHLLMKKYQLVLCWVPRHVGICGNELADQAAKDGTRSPKCDISLVPSVDTHQMDNF